MPATGSDVISDQAQAHQPAAAPKQETAVKAPASPTVVQTHGVRPHPTPPPHLRRPDNLLSLQRSHGNEAVTDLVGRFMAEDAKNEVATSAASAWTSGATSAPLPPDPPGEPRNVRYAHGVQRQPLHGSSPPPRDIGGGQTLVQTDNSSALSRDQGTEIREVDPVRLTRSAHAALTERLSADRSELLQVRARVAEHQAQAGSSSSPRSAADVRSQQIDEARDRELDSRIFQGQRDLATLTGGGLDQAAVRSIVARNELELGSDAGQVTVAGRRNRRQVSIDSSAATASAATTVTTDVGGSTQQSVTTRSIGTGGISSQTDVTTSTSTSSGTIGERRERSSHAVDASGYTRTRETREQVSSVEGDRASVTNRQTSGIALGSGQIGYTSGRREEAQLTTAGPDGATSSASRSTSNRVGLVHGESGSGIAASTSSTNERTTGGVRRGLTRSADGRYTVNVEDLGTDPATYRITTTIHLGGSLSGSASRAREEDESGYRANASVTGRASGDLTFRRRLTADQASQYLGDLERVQSGTSADGGPEFGILARVRATRATGNMSAQASALISSRAAANLQAGEAIDLNLSAGGDVSLGGGGQGSGDASSRAALSLSAGVGATRGRRIRIERRGASVLITVTASGEERASGSATGSLGYTGMGVSGSGTRGATTTMTFRLDPTNQADYERHFSEISRLVTAEQLRVYATANSGLVDTRTVGQSGSSETGVTASVGPAGLGINQGRSRETSVTSGSAGLGATVSGGQTTRVDASVFGTTVASTTSGSAVTSTVSEADGIESDVTRTHSTSSLSQGLQNEREQNAGRRTEDVALGVLAQGPGTYMQNLLNAQATRLTRYRLTDADFRAVVSRANDSSNWMHAIARYQLIGPWEDLRSALVDPAPTREWLEQDHTEGHRVANQIAQASALADFMSEWGEHGGLEAVQYVLRQWGQRGLSLAAGNALGQLWEWPPSIARTETRFESVRTQTRQLDSQLESIAADRGSDVGHRLIDGLTTSLQQSIRDVENCMDFQQPRAKLEMLTNMRAVLRHLNRARRRFDRMLDRRMSVARIGEFSTAEVDTGGPQASMPSDVASGVQARDPNVEVRLREEIQSITATLERSKALEQERFREARTLLPRSAGGTLSGGAWDTLVHENWERAAELMRGLADTHMPWIESIVRLRELLRTSGDPTDSWPIRPSGSNNNRRLDPDIETTARLYLGALRQQTNYGLFDYVYESTASQWRARGHY